MKKPFIWLAMILAVLTVFSSCGGNAPADPAAETRGTAGQAVTQSVGPQTDDGGAAVGAETSPAADTETKPGEETEPSGLSAPTSGPTEPGEGTETPAPSVTLTPAARTEAVLYYGDARLGVLSSTQTKEDVTSALAVRLKNGVSPGRPLTVREEETDEEPLPFDALIDDLAGRVLDEEQSGYALYLSDNYIGAAASESAVRGAIDDFCAAIEKWLEEGTVELHGAELCACKIKKADIFSRAELAALISTCLNKGMIIVGVDYDRIMRYAAAIKLPADTFVICTSELQIEEKVVPFDVKTVEDPTRYKSYRLVESEGSSGLVRYTYNVTFENGVEVSRTLIGKTVLKEAVSRRVVVGTADAMFWPLGEDNIRVTSCYGDREHPIDGVVKEHGGIDLAGPQPGDIDRKPIYAAYDGVVKVVGDEGSSGYGKYVVIDHGKELYPGKRVETLYAHCNKIVVKEGQTVKKGEIIAYVGSTGKSTGPHLHFEVRVDGVRTDPLLYSYQLSLSSKNDEPIPAKDFIKTEPY